MADDNLKDLTAAQKQTNENLLKINENIKKQLEGVKEAVKEPPKDIEAEKEKKAENKKFLEGLKGILKSAGAGMVGTGGGLLEGVKKMMSKYKKIIMSLLGVGLVALFSQLNMEKIKEFWIKFKGALDAVYNTLKPIADKIWNWTKSTLLPSLWEYILDQWDAIKVLFTDLRARFDGWDQMSWKEKIMSVLGAFGDIAKWASEAIKNLLVLGEKLLGGDGTWITDVWKNMGDFFKKIITWLGDLFTDPKKTLQKLWDDIWEGVKNIADWIWNHTIGPAVKWIKGIFGWDDNKEKQPKEDEFDIWKLFKGTMESIYGFFRKIFNLDYVGMAVSLAKKSGEAGKWLLGEMGLIPGVESAKERLARESKEDAVGGGGESGQQRREDQLEQNIIDAQAGKRDAGEIIKKRRKDAIVLKEAENKRDKLEGDLAAQKARMAKEQLRIEELGNKSTKKALEEKVKLFKRKATREKEMKRIEGELETQKGVVDFFKSGGSKKPPIVTPLSPIKTGIDWDFISQKEGGSKLEGYVPDPTGSKSGVTIATGFDLGARGPQDIKGLSPELQAKLEPFLGLKGKDAVAALKSRGLKITSAEAREIDKMSKGSSLSKLRNEWNKNAKKMGGKMFGDLSSAQKTVAASVAFQYGSLDRTPAFRDAMQSGKWDEAVAELENFGDKYSTRRLSEAALLKNESGRMLTQAQRTQGAGGNTVGGSTNFQQINKTDSTTVQTPVDPRNNQVKQNHVEKETD